MAINRGKQFEKVIQTCFEELLDTSVDRIHDQTNGYLGSRNICDFSVYRYPNKYYFECKTVHGNLLPFSNISSGQWKGLLEKSGIKGCTCGIICWWIDKDVTKFIPIQVLDKLKRVGKKSIRYDDNSFDNLEIDGTKLRTFFRYDMEKFLNEIDNRR